MISHVENGLIADKESKKCLDGCLLDVQIVSIDSLSIYLWNILSATYLYCWAYIIHYYGISVPHVGTVVLVGY